MFSIKITKVHKISFPQEPRKKLRGWATVIFNNILLVSGIQLYEDTIDGKSIRYIRFPDKDIITPVPNGKRVKIAVVNTNNSEFRNYITDVVFKEYDRILEINAMNDTIIMDEKIDSES